MLRRRLGGLVRQATAMARYSTRSGSGTGGGVAAAAAASGNVPTTARANSRQPAHALTAFEQQVGDTPLLRLSKASEDTGCEILAKAEFANPGQSIKDRAALWIIRDAEARGVLARGAPGIIVEGTAGNTGIGLALAGKPRGYRVVICIADTQSQEKKDMLRWSGAELVEVPAVPFSDPNNYVHVAARLADALSTEQRVLYANQWDNLANRQAHVDGTGPEIWKQTRGAVDAFSCAMGTGGTLTGVAQHLRAVHPGVHIALTDPQGAVLYRHYTEGTLEAHGSSISEGIGQGRVTGNMEDFAPDSAHEISDAEMMQAIIDVQEHDGLALGTSSGINIAGAVRVAKDLGPGHTVVTVLCDYANRYPDKIYNAPFLRSAGLPHAPWIDSSVSADLESALGSALA